MSPPPVSIQSPLSFLVALFTNTILSTLFGTIFSKKKNEHFIGTIFLTQFLEPCVRQFLCWFWQGSTLQNPDTKEIKISNFYQYFESQTSLWNITASSAFIASTLWGSIRPISPRCEWQCQCHRGVVVMGGEGGGEAFHHNLAIWVPAEEFPAGKRWCKYLWRTISALCASFCVAYRRENVAHRRENLGMRRAMWREWRERSGGSCQILPPWFSSSSTITQLCQYVSIMCPVELCCLGRML